MGVKIDFKKCARSESATLSNGIKVTNQDGAVIDGVTSVTIIAAPDEMVRAIIEVFVDSVENLEAITAEFPHVEIPFIESQLKKHGYKMVKDTE